MNPYYKAWIELTGGGELYEYIIWINQKHREFKNINPEFFGYIERFSAWLELQCFSLEVV